jgi:hypothetical protein
MEQELEELLPKKGNIRSQKVAPKEGHNFKKVINASMEYSSL